MPNPAGESESGALRLDFDRRLTRQFRGPVVTSDAGLLAYRELDDALGLTALAGKMLADARSGKNGRHALVGLLRQSVFGRLAVYEDVNAAERLRHDPAFRLIHRPPKVAAVIGTCVAAWPAFMCERDNRPDIWTQAI